MNGILIVMFREFKKFISRGNVMDFAVGIILGTAFTAIVRSLVDHVIMPPIGLAIGGIDFSAIAVTLREATADSEAVVIGIGIFINAVVQFLIIAFVVFLMVRGINRLSEGIPENDEKPPAPPVPSTEEQLLAAIRELTAAVSKDG